jgi:hypothetical protein
MFLFGKRKCKCTRFWTLDKNFNTTLDASHKMFYPIQVSSISQKFLV